MVEFKVVNVPNRIARRKGGPQRSAFIISLLETANTGKALRAALPDGRRRVSAINNARQRCRKDGFRVRTAIVDNEQIDIWLEKIDAKV